MSSYLKPNYKYRRHHSKLPVNANKVWALVYLRTVPNDDAVVLMSKKNKTKQRDCIVCTNSPAIMMLHNDAVRFN